MIRHRRIAAIALVTVIPAAIVLSGCSVVDELVYQERNVQFATTDELTEGWSGYAPWVPADASDIRIREATSGATAVMLLTSASELDAALCTEVDRQSGPAYEIDGAPDAYAATRAFACGEWTVIASDDGWLAWTPNDPDEEAASPS